MIRRIAIACPLLLILVAGCGGTAHDEPHEHEHEAENWSVTIWGERYEIFAEVEPLIAGHAAASHTHVTVLSDFSPLVSGTVTAVLRAPDGSESTFAEEAPVRDGIYSVNIIPPSEGSFELSFVVESEGSAERIPAGTVRVGDEHHPGGLAAPAVAPAGEPLSFLKEQQWRTEFATSWVARGSLRSSVRGAGRVRPTAGGQVVLTAPVEGVLLREPWPFVGKRVRRGDAVLRLAPRVSPDRSVADLESSALTLRSELTVARDRAERLRRLVSLEAVSRAEAERAQGLVTTLEARLAAAERDLDAARSYRQGGLGADERLAIDAPFDGGIAEVLATPGEAVAFGAPLAQLVKTSPLWIEVAHRPEDARRIGSQPGGLIVRSSGNEPAIVFDADRVRLVAISPVVDDATGKVSVLFEVSGELGGLKIGSVVDAEVLLHDEIDGVIVPTSAIVDDGGVSIVYLQIDGESFSRHEIEVQARQGNVALVQGLEPGMRLVTKGGPAIRRASMLSSGPVEGHVH